MVNGSGEDRGAEALIEQFRREVQVVAENHIALSRKIDGVDRKIDYVEQALSKQMELGFSTLIKEMKLFSDRFQAHEGLHAN